MIPPQVGLSNRFDCSFPGCSRSVHKGDAIYRTSPKPGPFAGMCREHIARTDHEVDPAVREITTAIEEAS